MKEPLRVRITVEVDIDPDALEEAYSPGKLREVQMAYSDPGGPETGLVTMHLEQFAKDALDRYHGMPKKCVKRWVIVENRLVSYRKPT
jgi:hypothetical protein